MIKLQECPPPKESECFTQRLCLFWLGLIVLPSFSPAFKRHWSRCLRLFERLGWMGCASGTSQVAQHWDAPFNTPWVGMLLLPKFVILEIFPSIPGTDSVTSTVPWAMAAGATVGKGTCSVRVRIGGGRGVFWGLRWEPPHKPNPGP